MSNFDLNIHTARLLMDEPFFAAVSRRIDKRASYAIPTAGVMVNPSSAQFEMLYNPDFFEKLTDEERRDVLKHEFYHITFLHVTDRMPDGVKIKLWNIATDLAINSHLHNLPEGGLIPGEGVFKDLPRGMSAEWYLANLPKVTKDKKEMKVDTYSKWRVSDPLKFYETVRTTAGAHARLDDIIYSQTREVLGQHTLVEIVSGNRKEIREDITLRSRENAENFGIEILDVRIKRADLPEANSQSVFGRMNAERRRQAKLYRSEGEEESLKIRSDADRERVEILAEAKKTNEETRGEADAVATKIYADSYQKDADFFKFLRSHDVYRDSLLEGTTLLMDAESKFFKYLK